MAGRPGIRDQGLLESAVGMPQASFGGEFLHADLFTMAAAYAFHIAQNQAFVDGNKRAGLLSALVFLDMNGIVIGDPECRLYQAMIDIAEKTMDKSGLAELFLANWALPPAGPLRSPGLGRHQLFDVYELGRIVPGIAGVAEIMVNV